MENRPTLKEITSAANILFGVNVCEVNRVDDIKIPRQIAHYVAHIIYGYSQASTGTEIGEKTPATVLHSCNKIKNELGYGDRKGLRIKANIEKLCVMCENKDTFESKVDICLDLLRRNDVSAHAKIQVRKLLKMVKYESN